MIENHWDFILIIDRAIQGLLIDIIQCSLWNIFNRLHSINLDPVNQ